jgi:tRNA threonylcarbamoyladenosine biosynthesis protein TsaB
MLVLGIDTATPWGTVALYEERTGGDSEVIFEISFRAGRGGGEYLLSTVSNFVKKAGHNFADIDLITVGTGPGSYTGIRVGIAAVKGLAEGLQKPVWGINTLRVIAENAGFYAANYVGAVIDARHEQVYAALYQKTGTGLQELQGPRIIGVREFAAGLADFTPAIVCGDGSKIYRDIWNFHRVITGPGDWNRPSAGKLAQIAAKEWDPSFQSNLTELKACYLQRVEAEIRLEEKLHAVNRQPHED